MGRKPRSNATATFSLPRDLLDWMDKELKRRHGSPLPHGAKSEYITALIEKDKEHGNNKS